jgi:peptidyl-tRNA hydrolase ICT1
MRSIAEDMRLIPRRVNSKATARFQLKDLTPLVPSIIHQQLQKSQYYAPKSQTLVIHADGSRKQSDNVDQCFHTLRDLILAAGKTVVKGETSPEQRARVKQLYVR